MTIAGIATILVQLGLLASLATIGTAVARGRWHGGTGGGR